MSTESESHAIITQCIIAKNFVNLGRRIAKHNKLYIDDQIVIPDLPQIIYENRKKRQSELYKKWVERQKTENTDAWN